MPQVQKDNFHFAVSSKVYISGQFVTSPIFSKRYAYDMFILERFMPYLFSNIIWFGLLLVLQPPKPKKWKTDFQLH